MRLQTAIVNLNPNYDRARDNLFLVAVDRVYMAVVGSKVDGPVNHRGAGPHPRFIANKKAPGDLTGRSIDRIQIPVI